MVFFQVCHDSKYIYPISIIYIDMIIIVTTFWVSKKKHNPNHFLEYIRVWFSNFFEACFKLFTDIFYLKLYC